jgi:hypothetical protein
LLGFSEPFLSATLGDHRGKVCKSKSQGDAAMKKTLFASLFALAISSTAVPALSAELKVSGDDSIESVLKGQAGNRVMVRLRAGQEITGTVRVVNSRIVQLGGVSGREFFDAVVPLASVDAVMIRTRDK